MPWKFIPDHSESLLLSQALHGSLWTLWNLKASVIWAAIGPSHCFQGLVQPWPKLSISHTRLWHLRLSKNEWHVTARPTSQRSCHFYKYYQKGQFFLLLILYFTLSFKWATSSCHMLIIQRIAANLQLFNCSEAEQETSNLSIFRMRLASVSPMHLNCSHLWF